MSLVIGLTGGIGSGKSTVAGLLSGHGAGIIDTDEISHQLSQSGGEAISPIRSAFGDAYIAADGALDRAAMRKLVFADAGARKKLEDILHPLIRKQSNDMLHQLGKLPYVVMVVPLLPQSPSFLGMVQRVAVVDCDEMAQIERVIKRTGLNEAEVRAIIASQTPRMERLRIADDIIRNDSGLAELSARIEALHGNYLKIAQNND